MDSMQAFRIHRFGGPEVLQHENLPIPQCGPGQALVEIAAASVNPVDYKTRAGKYPLVRADQLPYTLGRDFAGRVVRASDLGGLEAGAAVYAFVGQEQGAFAEYIVIDADRLARKPDSLDFATAAAVPLAGLTAWQGLFDHGRLASGQRVLIHAAAGGVGHLAVQFAKARGAEVYATASGDGVAFVKGLGADVVLDYKQTKFDDAVRDLDMVFDLVGGETQERSWAVLRDGGALISTLTEPSRERAAARRIRAARYTARPDASQLAEIGRLIDAGQVQVKVTRTFPFVQTPEAERQLEAGHIRGKMVVTRELH